MGIVRPSYTARSSHTAFTAVVHNTTYCSLPCSLVCSSLGCTSVLTRTQTPCGSAGVSRVRLDEGWHGDEHDRDEDSTGRQAVPPTSGEDSLSECRHWEMNSRVSARSSRTAVTRTVPQTGVGTTWSMVLGDGGEHDRDECRGRSRPGRR